jgi:VWFA-related protein
LRALLNLGAKRRGDWRSRREPRSWHSFLIAVLLPTLFSPSGSRFSGQEPRQTTSIKVVATSVEVDVIVTDDKGRHVSGLTAADFRVYENDAPQKIVSFIPPVQPADVAKPAVRSGLPPDATQEEQTQTTAQRARQASVGSHNPEDAAPAAPSASARHAGAKQAPANISEAERLAHIRFITIVFDIADIQPGNLKRARDAAEKYLKTGVASEDFVAIYRVDSSLHLMQPFTQDRDQAARAVRKITEYVTAGRLTAQQRVETQEEIDGMLNACLSQQGGFGTRLTGAGCDESALKTLQNYLWDLSTMQARAVLVALRSIAQTYSDIPGRKNVVVFSEGFIHSPAAQAQLSSTIDAASRANVAFYVIDASGLTAPSGAQSRVMEVTDNEEAFVAANAGPGSNKFDWIARLGKDNIHDDLQQLATGTGGLLMKNRNDLLAGLSQVDKDLREEYTLVYRPANANYDGAFRHIRVEVANQRYHVRYRLGYWAIPPSEEMLMSPAAAQLLAGIASGELRPSFAPELNGTVLLARNGRLAAPVRVTLPAKEVKFEKDPDRDVYHGGITFLLLARDSAGHIASVHQRFISLEFDSRHLVDFQKQALAIDARMAIPKLEPLTLEAILQFANGAVAMGEEKVALVAGSSGPQLSGLLLTNRVQAATEPSDPADPLHGSGFQLEVPAQPQFARSDKLTAYFGAVGVPQDPSSGKPYLKLLFSIRQADAVVATLPPEPVVGASGQDLLLILKQIDLGSVIPGKYALQVTAENSSGQVVTSQSADFTVVPGAAPGAESAVLEPGGFVLAGDEDSASMVQPLGPSRATEGRDRPTMLNAPLNELVRSAHELKGIVPALGQDELPAILNKVADNVELFVRNFPNTAATEEIQQQVLESGSDSTVHKFRYLALTDPGAPAARLHEFRQDSGGHEVDARSMMRGTPIVTEGFVSMPLLFHPQYRMGSDFRLLGQETLERRETYVIGFAQRNAAAFSGRVNLSGHSVAALMQGLAWVDVKTCQILRIKTWLLPGPSQASVGNVATTVDFSEVHFKNNSAAFWLPRDVVVEVGWRGKLYTNHHHYSGYKLFSVEAGERAPRS